MSTSKRDLPRAMAVRVTDDSVEADLEDGRTIIVPIVWFPRLLAGTPEQRQNLELIGDGIGIHWPDLDEDLSVEGFLNPPVRQQPVRRQPQSAELVSRGYADSDHPANGSGRPVRRPSINELGQ